MERSLSHPSARTVLHRFSLAAWRASPPLAVAEVLLTLFAGALPAATLWAGRALVDAIVGALAAPAHGISALVPWALALAGLAAAANLTLIGRQAVTASLRPRVRLALERELLAAAAGIDLLTFEQPATQERLERARQALGHRLTNLLLALAEAGVAAITLVGYGLLLWSVSPWLLAVVAVPAGPSLAFKLRTARSRFGYEYDASPLRRAMGYFRGLLLGTGSARELRLFGLTGHLSERWQDNHRGWRAGALVSDRAEAGADLATTAVHLLAQGTAIAIVGLLIVRGSLTVGDYVVLAGAAAAFAGEVEGLMWQVRGLAEDLPNLEALQAFLDMAATTRAGAGARAFPRPLRAGLAVAGLTFRYPGADEPVLSEVSFALRPGQCVALVGPNGAGKSTLIRLLLGLYPPTSGAITYDGTPLGEIAPSAVAANCAAVFQDFARFRRPLREELAPGRPRLAADDAALLAALAGAGLDPAGAGMPAGLDTFLDASLGDEGRGIELSGGQWQKVAIARALARDAAVLVLDEPAAALDPEAELALYRRFAGLVEGRLTIIASHRLGLGRLADVILVLARGRLVEQGTHGELLAARGLYAAMFEQQAAWYRGTVTRGGDAGA